MLGKFLHGGALMGKHAIIPPEFRIAAEQLKMSPAIVTGDYVFLTGVTGSDVHGQMPHNPETQIRNAFEKIGLVLHAGGLTFQSVAEMTTYHVGLRDHFDLFDAIRLECFDEPYPAWTAVEVAGLRREGAIVEIRVIASTT
jgi:enamine deaminase RidA (YjgF/YER057c/UK114 family)